MAKNKDRNYISVGFWLFSMFIMAIPCLNVVMAIVWALMGENETRKNYFRAMILWFSFWTLLWAVIMLAGFWPAIERYFRGLLSA